MTNTEDVWEKISQRRPVPADHPHAEDIRRYPRNSAADKVRAYIKDLVLANDPPGEIGFTYVDGDLIAAYWDGEREHHFSVFVEMNPITDK